MVTNIESETRKHLLVFLQKLLTDQHSQSELENFAIMQYQNTDLEEVRVAVLRKMTSLQGGLKTSIDSESDRTFIEQLVIEIDKLVNT